MDYNVVIPENIYTTFKFKQDKLVGIGVVNSALINFEPKIVFSWHLSIMIEFNDLIDNGMPSFQDRSLAENWEDEIDPLLIEQLIKPNAIFLARITWNGTRELIYRVYNPELSDVLLRGYLNKTKLPFDYRIDQDESWGMAKWHLDCVRK